MGLRGIPPTGYEGTDEAAARRDLSVRQVRRLIRSGRLVSQQSGAGGHHWLPIDQTEARRRRTWRAPWTPARNSPVYGCPACADGCHLAPVGPGKARLVDPDGAPHWCAALDERSLRNAG